MNATLHIHDEAGYRTTSDLTGVPALLAAGARLWIDAWGNDGGISTFLLEVLHIHPLAVEDILQDRPQPKVEDYGEYLYVVVHGIVHSDGNAEVLETVELDLVLTSQWIFTHHNHGANKTPGNTDTDAAGGTTSACIPVSAVAQELSRNAKLMERGPGFVAHAILDHLVDYYMPVVDAFDDQIDEVEALVIEQPSRRVLERLFRLKRSLQRLRRIAVYQREVLKRLSRGEFDVIPEKALPFYRDVYDHFVRVADLADSYRELLSGALDAYLSVVSNRMNEVMKALTLVATVMLPVTFIAGVYGMNFEYMPELKWRYGYFFALGLMAAVTGTMVYWFKRKKWI